MSAAISAATRSSTGRLQVLIIPRAGVSIGGQGLNPSTFGQQSIGAVAETHAAGLGLLHDAAGDTERAAPDVVGGMATSNQQHVDLAGGEAETQARHFAQSSPSRCKASVAARAQASVRAAWSSRGEDRPQTPT